MMAIVSSPIIVALFVAIDALQIHDNKPARSHAHIPPGKHAEALHARRAFERATQYNPTDAKHLKLGNTEDSGGSLDDVAENICEDVHHTNKHSLFYKANGNGHDVRMWQKTYPNWPVKLTSDANNSCLLKGANWNAAKGMHAVLDFGANNEIQCCQKNASKERTILRERHDFAIAGKDHPDKQYFYEYIIPDVCLPGVDGSKAPCPLLVSLHGMGLDHMPVYALQCSGCVEELSSVVLMPYMPMTERTEHELVWDSEDWLGEEYVRNLTLTFMQNYTEYIDKRRVYLFGLSMGGGGALMAALTQPDIFTQIFSVSPTSWVSKSMKTPSKAKKWRDVWSQRSGATRRLKKVFTFMGGEDIDGEDIDWGLLPKAMAKVGIDASPVFVEYRVFPELAHACWNAAFNEAYEVVWRGAATEDPMWRVLAVLSSIAAIRFASQILSSQASGKTAQKAGLHGDASSTPVVDFKSKSVPVIKEATQEQLVNRAKRTRLPPFSTFLDLLRPNSAKLALSATDGRKPLTHADMYKIVKETDLARFGVAPQTKVATMMPAGDQAAALLLSMFARYAVAPLSYNLTKDELAVAVERLEIKTILTTSENAERLGAMPEGCRLLVVAASTQSVGQFELDTRQTEGAPIDVKAPSRLNGPDDIVLLLQTSGTTSKPKTVPITLGRLMLGSVTFAEAMGLSDADCGLSVAPLYHIGGILTNLLALMLTGGSVVCSPFLQSDEFMGWMKTYRVSYFSSVPSVHAQVLTIYAESDAKQLAGANLKKLTTGAAHMPHNVAVRLRQATGATIIPTYGMSEHMPIASAPFDYELQKPDSVGIPVSEVKIISEEGQEAPTGERGEVCVRGPLLMPEYLTGENRNMHAEGWFRTGDLGVLDSQGWLFLVGRSKEVINRGGELVSPFEVESALSKMPGVDNCLCFAAPHQQLGEAVAVAVICDGSRSIGLSTIRRFLLDKLEAAKVPEVVVFMTDLPKGNTGKAQRIGTAEKLRIQPLSAETPNKGRALVAELVGDIWLVRPVESDADDPEEQPVVVTDSLGMKRQLASETDVQAQLIELSLYGVIGVKLIWQHWLPSALDTTFPHATPLLPMCLGFVRNNRTLLSITFPLLGFIDGRTAADVAAYRTMALAFVYVAMAWPTLPIEAVQGFATFHRWPLAVLICAQLIIYGSARVSLPKWIQVLVPLSLAPMFGKTHDCLHKALGMSEHPKGGSLRDPSLWILEHEFYWSVGAKLYFLGCYLFAYHYLSRKEVADRIIKSVATATCLQRCAAYLSFAALTVAWQSVTAPVDPLLDDHVADWPGFLGVSYPLQVLCDWTSMALLAVAIGTGNQFLRLIGSSVLGVMIFHMYLQLPFPTILEEAARVGGPALVIVGFVAVPVIFSLSVGFVCQWLLLSVPKLIQKCSSVGVPSA